MLLNALMYADDTILMADNEADMKILIEIVQKYCEANEIKLNMEKAVYIIANNNSKTKLKIDNIVLEPENSTKYLGYMINKWMNSKEHIDLRIKNTLKRYYSLNILGLNAKSVDPFVKAQIINSFCLPILYYSIENAELTRRQRDDVRSTVGELIKKSINIRKQSHITDLMPAIGIRDPNEAIELRKIGLFLRLMENQTTSELLIEENAEIILGNDDANKTFLEQIYDILCEVNFNHTDELEAKCVNKVEEIENQFIIKQAEPRVVELRKLLEENNTGKVEELLMPEGFRLWLDNEINDTNDRVMYLHRLYDAREELESLNLNF